ncbi:L-2-hydroxyglutarate dehydrogenase, mitochondrial-like isoform X2 [Homarus americanus]|uniref:L-2-hydroxyglutarate dehydrogenase, mitochondrial-like isoform X2 n=1 Tax=Homarus americanus TaxID=6706 RepID=UPI001C486F43|nr:L-2-hydroxyglutarate dehydrogenase, mitochondrial-like isoform X2 [Homarus americanus]
MGVFTTLHEPEYDIVIVGGGIVGMATARELALKHPHLKLSVVEKEDKLAFHQSGHNSGVIHAGIYYKPGSLKARLCVEGLQLAYEYLDKEGIPYKKCGKLIVAVNDKEVGRLLDLYDRAIHNGVPDVELIEGNEIKKYEPYCQGVKAIWSPHTGIVDWGLVTEHYGKNFRDCGGSIYLDFKVTDFQLTEDSKTGTTAAEYPVKVISNGRAVRCKYVLTCGGLQSDKLAKLSGCSEDPRIVPFRGEYLLLKKDKAHMVRGNIYPVPDPRFPFLGVHFTPRMNGDIWLGPNAIFALKREGYRWLDIDTKELWESVTYRGFQKLALQYLAFGFKEVLFSAFPRLQVATLRKYIPDISASDISRGPAGVRAQAMNVDGSLEDDFVFHRESGSALGSRILHCRNAPSPGATSSLSIAKMIADKCRTEFSL